MFLTPSFPLTAVHIRVIILHWLFWASYNLLLFIYQFYSILSHHAIETQVETIWFSSGVLALNSTMKILSFCKYFNQLQWQHRLAVLTAALYNLKGMYKDIIFIVLSCEGMLEENQMVPTLTKQTFVLIWKDNKIINCQYKTPPSKIQKSIIISKLTLMIEFAHKETYKNQSA